MNTKFGNAEISNRYYRITSGKEGNNGKLLHRLIWEDFYNTEVPKGYVIHHKDHNPLNNCILNLQLMKDGEHHKLHNTGKKHSDETKIRMGENNARYWKDKTFSDEHKTKLSEAHNTSGYYRVRKQKCKKCKYGYTWVYAYYDSGKYKTVSSVDIEKLEAKVKGKGLKWKKLKGDE